MTVIAAIKKEGEVWIAADRLTSWAEFTRGDLSNGGKLAFYKNAVIGSAGRSLYGNALRYCANQYPKMYKADFNNEDDLFRFFYQFYDFIKKNYNLGSSESNDVSKLSYSQFIVATPSKIFEVSSCRDVCVFDNFTVIGSGHNLMVGAIHALDGVLDDPQEILKRSYDTTCHYVSSCGGEMDLYNVKKELKRQNAQRIKSKKTKTSTKAKAKSKTKAVTKGKAKAKAKTKAKK